ncbi:GGDEF domain-containing protein [Massilia eurypsychrophila]|uniref:GGDEF domain-containing protein n=1 Tax=Massilia eurypsychrophila TaxID=1485217 RepID=A0A2G8TEX9_9BURK|nr:EAL domain-containing protein [Massilia eurypsychrophila]PIL44602.1 GGDEF domain-containing protein [Massilia eurypsychrophila]
MLVHPASDFIASSGALCDAVLRLRGKVLHEELGRIARCLLASPYGVFAPANSVGIAEGEALPADVGQLRQEVSSDDNYFGLYTVFGRSSFSDDDRHLLASLAKLTAGLLQVHSLAQRSTHAYVQVEAQLAHQLQILDQIQESVLTLDPMGYITSWNKGAERLFGYSDIEAIGNHILFLYVDEEAGHDAGFADAHGSMMEVRRRKKSGEVFWASMTLTPLRNGDEQAVGLIAYLSDITERKQAEERLHHLAYYDALTSLPNRTLLTKLIDQALMAAQRNSTTGCVLFIDLNRFKWINDTLGRRIGDELLRQVSLRFRATLREEDIVARLSGDEFVVGLFDIRQHFEATTVAQKLQASLLEPFLIEGHDLLVGASIGISVYPQDGGDAETLLRLADIAMARAKQSHDSLDDSVAFYSLDMNQGMHERMRIESGLRHALGNGELLLHYQPKFQIEGGRIVGAEALVRWLHPERGIVPPADFIPLAETTGLIVQVGEWVLEAACAQAAIWQRAGVPPLRIAINVSAREFTATLPGRLAATLARYGLDPCWLELEITESALMHDIERVIDIMGQINALGVTLSLDDFGTGYSSLSYLKRFPIHTLKIDRSFTTGLPGDASGCAIATTIISIGQQLKHKVIAEGVETVEQLEFLRASGCDEVQGYLFSRPLPADAFETALRENWLLV